MSLFVIGQRHRLLYAVLGNDAYILARGEPHSDERFEHILELDFAAATRIEQGLTPRLTPPAGRPYGTELWYDFIDGLEEGTNIQSAAHATPSWTLVETRRFWVRLARKAC